MTIISFLPGITTSPVSSQIKRDSFTNLQTSSRDLLNCVPSVIDGELIWTDDEILFFRCLPVETGKRQ